MARSSNQKLKTLYLAQYLMEESDEQHLLTVQQMITYLASNGITAERKSIYDDLDALAQFGLDILHVEGRSGGYYLASRPFELAELKLLVDAVQSSRFLTRKKSLELIGKIESLASRHEAQSLQRQVFVTNRIKTMNESIYYNVDELHAAIALDRQITFRYFEYAVPKQRVYRHGGAPYRISPFALTWDDENYYLIGYDDAAQRLKHFRVDKMTGIAVTDAERTGKEVFGQLDLGLYAGTLFGMFSGETQDVLLRFENRLVGAVIDRFGSDVAVMPDGDTHFTIRVRVAVSEQFFGYLAGFGAAAQVLEPPSVAAAMAKHIESIAALYKKDSVSE
jgi:predicted DNA-binding transcriptional regulator YafY